MTNLQDTKRFVNILNKKEKFYIKWLKRLMLKLGYITVPKDYPKWLTKTASSSESQALFYDKKNPYMAGKWSGRAGAMLEVERELQEFRYAQE